MPTPRLFRTLTSLTFVTLVLLPSVQDRAHADTQLRWKFKPGDETRYIIEQATKISVNLNGQSFVSTHNITWNTTWQVKDFTDRQATIVHRFTRGRLKLSSPQGSLEFDSNSDEAPTGPLANTFVKPLRSMINADFQMTIDTRGKIHDMVLPETVRTMLDSNPAAGQMLFSPDSLKKMFSFLVFPEAPIPTGHKWLENQKTSIPGGALHIGVTATYKGREAKDAATLERFDIKLQTSFQKGEDSKFDLKIKSQESSGFALFDNNKGQFVRSNVIQKLDMEVDYSGNVIAQQVETTADFRRQPPSP